MKIGRWRTAWRCVCGFLYVDDINPDPCPSCGEIGWKHWTELAVRSVSIRKWWDPRTWRNEALVTHEGEMLT